MKILLAAVVAAVALSACSSKPTQAPVAKGDTPTRSVSGHLIAPDGKSLYVYAQDAANSGKSACYDACAKAWPPLLATPTAKPAGDYTLITRTDGSRQWSYKGAPLYTFAKDSKAGEQTGSSVSGWKLAQP